ncbi:helix-turn-helix domain-containing protein [Brytella acorum]|uniref:helix-turn-helix domain-containing protein n=1 Tax=Brytella acorum TaxID=2959299 RepID=UPI0037429D63
MHADSAHQTSATIHVPVFLRVSEAAALVRRHPETLRRAIREGRLTAWRQPGCTLVSVEALMVFMEGFLCPAREMKNPISNPGAGNGVSSGGKRENDVDFRLAQRMKRRVGGL